MTPSATAGAPASNSVEKPEMFQDEPFPPLAQPAAGKCPVAGVPGSAPSVNITILALDMGNHCGWALRRRDGRVLHGTEDFTPRASWTPGQRWQRFRSWLAGLIVDHGVNAIAYEQVLQGGWAGGKSGHRSGAAGDIYGGFKAMVEVAADAHRLELHPANVSTVKKHFTGNGRAKKEDMISQAKIRGFRVSTSDEADALGILHWAVMQEKAGWPAPVRKAKPTRRSPVRANPRQQPAATRQSGLFEVAR